MSLDGDRPDGFLVVQLRRHDLAAGSATPFMWVSEGAVHFEDEMEAHNAASLVAAIPRCHAYFIRLPGREGIEELTIERYEGDTA